MELPAGLWGQEGKRQSPGTRIQSLLRGKRGPKHCAHGRQYVWCNADAEKHGSDRASKWLKMWGMPAAWREQQTP